MEEIQMSKKTKIIIMVVCIVIAIIAIVIIATSGSDKNNNTNNGNKNNTGDNVDIGNNDPVTTVKEKELDTKTAEELFNKLPLVYSEEFAPFTDNFMLTCAMTLVSKEENPNYAASHVDAIVEEIFGNGVAINKENVTEMDITKSLYYYYPETGTYCIVPVGMENVYMTQLLKYATKDDNYTYVYTNEINGSWHQEEEKTVVVIGDKNGNDIVKTFDNYEDIQDYSVWQKEYKDTLPVFRYTLKNVDGKYILTGVEKVNY